MSDINLLETKWEVEQIVPKENGQKVEKESHSCDVFFVNLGSTTAFINELPLLPNTSVSFDGKTGNVDNTSWRIQSDIPVGKLGVWMCRNVYTGKRVKV